ncbi:MAG TPA: glutamate-1-semialdehyde 2,1-aminomutase [Candidatus Riflebacteria bacterium]|nr:glutamate-1-semialdehyde 2,1-aminomutase [Candidatus Riflebacteria bacterium]
MYDAPKLNLSKSFKEFERGKTCTPGGVLGIRRPYNFVEGEYPIYFEHGKGGRITDIDGNEYLDYLCAYGPIIIGHREEEVDNAAIEQIRSKGFCFSLTQSIQNKLAEKIKSLIKCAEMAVFVKTGSDATTLATRIARGYTGRNKIIRCGYHGWHDWCVEVKGGVPAKLYEDVFEFHYNHLDQLEDLLKQHGSDVAAIIITPIGHPLAEQCTYPKPGFLEGVRKLADQYGAVLIFDEIRTGFRVNMGGAQTLLGVTPDLATFGKALANGYPIGACVGKTQFMKKVEKEVFISSTFFPNSLEFAAALKTLEILERDKVLDVIKKKGQWFNAELAKITAKHQVETELSPVPEMPFVTFKKNAAKTYKEMRKDFYTQLIRRKVFLQPYHHGYICYRHTDEDLKYTLESIDQALSYVDTKKY